MPPAGTAVQTASLFSYCAILWISSVDGMEISGFSFCGSVVRSTSPGRYTLSAAVSSPCICKMKVDTHKSELHPIC